MIINTTPKCSSKICLNAQKPSGLACERRVAVSADLSADEWPDALIAAGFDPDRPSFFLLEGLLMFLQLPQATLCRNFDRIM